jgi:hypothetical protein
MIIAISLMFSFALSSQVCQNCNFDLIADSNPDATVTTSSTGFGVAEATAQSISNAVANAIAQGNDAANKQVLTNTRKVQLAASKKKPVVKAKKTLKASAAVACAVPKPAAVILNSARAQKKTVVLKAAPKKAAAVKKAAPKTKVVLQAKKTVKKPAAKKVTKKTVKLQAKPVLKLAESVATTNSNTQACGQTASEAINQSSDEIFQNASAQLADISSTILSDHTPVASANCEVVPAEQVQEVVQTVQAVPAENTESQIIVVPSEPQIAAPELPVATENQIIIPQAQPICAPAAPAVETQINLPQITTSTAPVNTCNAQNFVIAVPTIGNNQICQNVQLNPFVTSTPPVSSFSPIITACEYILTDACCFKWYETIPEPFWINLKKEKGRTAIALTTNQGTYISADCVGNISNSAKTVTNAEIWFPEKIGGKVIALRSWYGGYLGVDDNGILSSSSRTKCYGHNWVATLAKGNCDQDPYRFLALRNAYNGQYLSSFANGLATSKDINSYDQLFNGIYDPIYMGTTPSACSMLAN